MRLIRPEFRVRSEVLILAAVLAGCSSGQSPAGAGPAGGGGSKGAEATGGSRTGGRSGAGGSAAGTGGAAGSGGSMTATPDASAPPDATVNEVDMAAAPDASPGAPDVPALPTDGPATPMGTDGGPQPSYAGEIPIYRGPPVGPIVEMQCPGDPTEGWTEYQDSFNVQRPYNLPINTRFSIIGGIYNFWVFPNDAPHSPTANGRNPRTEARYGGTADVATGKNFQTGNRMYSADMLIERNAVNSAIMQIHTTADGGGPIGVRIQANSDMVNNGSLTVVQGSSVPGGLIDKWFNFKASLNADTQEVKIYINNCLKSTYKGPRGDGNFYFKNGVYFCKTSQNGCYSHYKNIHLYRK
jgi:hypothetical protein